LNSKLLEWFLHQTATSMRGGWFSYESRFISSLPIRAIDFANPADKSAHEKMVGLVSQMLALHKSKAGAKTQSDVDVYERQIKAVDEQIDRLVYQLYGLTEEEIKIVEGK